MERKHMIYVSGAFTSYLEDDADRRREEEHRRNIAQIVAKMLFRAGWMVYCPFDTFGELPLTAESWSHHEDWMQQDRYILKQCCHSILMLGADWKNSKGAVEEYELMKALNRRIFFSPDEAIKWLYQANRVWQLRRQQMPDWYHQPVLGFCPNKKEHEDSPHNVYAMMYSKGNGQPLLLGNPLDESVWLTHLRSNAEFNFFTWLCPTCEELKNLKGGK